MDIIEQVKQETNIDKLMEYSKSKDIKVLEALASNENIDGNSLLQIKNIIINCGVNSSIPSKYSLILLDDNTINLSLENQEINRENFILLKSKTKITRLDLQNVKILDNSGKRLSDNEFNDIKETDTFKNMSLYPAQGCIQKINDIWIVKLCE